MKQISNDQSLYLPGTRRRLRVSLSSIQLVALSVGSMAIFMTIFGSYGPLAAAAGSGIIFVMIFGGLVAIPNAIIYAHMATLFPEAGGAYSIIRNGVGKVFGSTFFLLQLLSWISSTGLIADEVSGLVHGEWPAVNATLFAVLLILLMFAITLLTVRMAGGISVIVMALELLFIAFWIVWGLTHLHAPISSAFTFPPRFLGTSGHLGKVIPLGTFFVALPLGVLFIDGYEQAISFAEEVKNYRSVRKGIVQAAIVAIISYIVAFPLLFLTDPQYQRVASSAFPGGAVVHYVLPAGFGAAVVIWVAMSGMNAGLAIFMTGSRLIFAAARDGQFGRRIGAVLSTVTPAGVPFGATVLWLAPTLIIALITSLGALFSFTSVLLLFLYIGLALSSVWVYLQVVRHTDLREGAFRLFPLVPAMVTVLSVVVIAGQAGNLILVSCIAFVVCAVLGFLMERSIGLFRAQDIALNSTACRGPLRVLPDGTFAVQEIDPLSVGDAAVGSVRPADGGISRKTQQS
jgi:amino acid transporter